MRRLIPLLVLGLALALVAGTFFRSSPSAGGFDIDGFGRLPVLANGRIKPIDTVARTSLLTFQGRQRVSDPAVDTPFAASPSEWFAQLCFAPEKADTFPTFRIDSPELLALMGITEEDTRITYTNPVKRTLAVLGFLPSTRARFSFEKLQPRVQELERQARLASGVEPARRSRFQKTALTLYSNLGAYRRLQYSLAHPDSADWLGELTSFRDNLAKAVTEAQAREAGQPSGTDALKAVAEARTHFEFMAGQGSLLAIPPRPGAPADAWRKTGQGLLDTFETGSVDPAAYAYAGLAYAWRTNNPTAFNDIIGLYRKQLATQLRPQLSKAGIEARFNAAQPFNTAISLYVLAFLLGVASWLRWPDVFARSGFSLLVVAWVLTTAGIAARMWLEGRPPVTNLYSSAVGVAWVGVTLSIVLEAIYKNAIGTVVAGALGFGALIIAHHLSFRGDTMEMMRAVLDSNFWLATHVVTITIGYGAMFGAGFLAILYIVMGVFTGWLDRRFDAGSATAIAAVAAPGAVGLAYATKAQGETNGQALQRMVYGIVCFATLFSVVGTILGGIWADQSWGRFWGWDPKENGALMIVLWNAVYLHCRWGGLARTRGLMALAVFGNIVTAWSWFGVNMLGVGLHSYGFMDSAFWWLIAFALSQLAIIALAMLVPENRWRSFRPKQPSEA